MPELQDERTRRTSKDKILDSFSKAKTAFDTVAESVSEAAKQRDKFENANPTAEELAAFETAYAAEVAAYCQSAFPRVKQVLAAIGAKWPNPETGREYHTVSELLAKIEAAPVPK